MSSSTNKPEQKYKTVHVGSLAEEFAKNDDIVDYIQGSSLERLKSKYAEAEEDTKIRDGRRTPGTAKAPSAHAHDAEKIHHDALETPTSPSPVSRFQSAASRYDNDKVLFGDIKLEKKEEAPATPQETPAAKKRGRPPKAQPVEDETTSSRDEKFNTNTRVIFVDSNVKDGIKRTDELEVSSAFGEKRPKKHRKFFRR